MGKINRQDNPLKGKIQRLNNVWKFVLAMRLIIALTATLPRIYSATLFAFGAMTTF